MSNMNFRRPWPSYIPLIALFAGAAVLLPVLSSKFMLIKVQEESMSPTLADGQWVVVIRGASKIHPGDIAVFVNPMDNGLAVKRCILTEENPPLVEHGWLVTPWGRWFLTGPQWNRLDGTDRLKDDAFYMVGDNQFRSLDSRTYGYVPRENIIGRVWIPPGRRNHG